MANKQLRVVSPQLTLTRINNNNSKESILSDRTGFVDVRISKLKIVRFS